MGIVEQYLLQLKSEKRRWRRTAAILVVLSLFVATGVSWNLRMTGIANANGATCGQEEHQHTEGCPVEKVLICGYGTEAEEQEPPPAPATDPATASETEAAAEPTTEPATESAADDSAQSLPTSASETVPKESAPPAEQMPPEQHTHTDECYQVTYQCGFEEHIHVLSCYSDTTADIESAVIWEADLPELTDDWADDLVRVAGSQLGCGESERNYIVADDTETRNGITRYGQWYGNPHGDWSAMFVLFCLHYAEIPQEAVPWSPGTYNMMRLMQDAQIFRQPDENLGTKGNLLFLDTDANGNADRIVVVCGHDSGALAAIGGDWDNMVAQITIPDTDPGILGYVNIRKLQEARKTQEETEPSQPTEPDAAEPTGETTPDETSDEPAIYLDVAFPEEGILRLVAQISNIEEDMYTWQWQVSEDGNEPWTDIDGATELVCELEGTEENVNRYYRLLGQKVAVMQTFALRATGDEEENTDLAEDDDIIISEPIAPFSIERDGGTYTIEVFALPVDDDVKRIEGLDPIELDPIVVTYSSYNNPRATVKDSFDTGLGDYVSAYFGTATEVDVDDIASLTVTRAGMMGNRQYTLNYRLTNTNRDVAYLTNQESSASLYLRYKPKFTVTFASEGFESLKETVGYNATPTLTEPSTWTREGYTLLGWTIGDDEQNVYTFEEIIAMPVTGDVTYSAKWANQVTLSFDLGEYTDEVYPIEPMVVPYGGTVWPIPGPIWKNNTVSMSFDGWYLDEACTQPVTEGHQFMADATLYAKWSPKEDGYYVYFMDFEREGEVPLVLVTASVTEGNTVAPYTPGNAPTNKEWNGTWYLDSECTVPYDFNIPVSEMEGYLTGANGRDLYLYPGMRDVCKAIFVTYGTKVDPVTVPAGGTINLDLYRPERTGYVFKQWTLKDGTPVSGVQTLNETTTFYAEWEPSYVPFEAILRTENANDTGMTQSEILGTWYAMAGSQIRVKSTYTGTGDSRTGTHDVVCVVDGVEYPVYKDAARTQRATLNDVYSTYFLYNNAGTNWTDEVNWDDVYTGGELPYSTRMIRSTGDTIINFDYMRVRNDIVFTIPNNSSTGGYIDVYKLQQNGLITGAVIYDGTKPTANGQNVSAHGVSAENISWSYTAAASVGNNYNYYTLHDMKYGQRIYEVYPVGASWLTARKAAYHQYLVENRNSPFASRRQDLTADFFKGTGRGVAARSLTAEFEDQEYIALMYAVECLEGETPDFTINGVGYKVDAELCEVVKHTGGFSIKALDGCEAGVSVPGTSGSSNKYYTAKNISWNDRNVAVDINNATIGNTSVEELFGETYWPYYQKFNGVQNINTFAKMYIFYYNRLEMNIQFNFGYDKDGNGENDTIKYEDIGYGERIGEYQFGMPDYQRHPYLEREGYQFVGWTDTNGFVLEAEDWESIVATGDSENNTMIFMAKWEKISNNIVEYYEDRSSTELFEYHYFDDGEIVPYPTMSVYPEGWVWQEYGEGQFEQFDWNVPMYGEYGVEEVRVIDGEERVVNVIRVYGTWDESHTKVVYDPNPPQGGIPGTAPTDPNEYTMWDSEVPVAAQGSTANTDPNMIFVGWQLDKNGVVYQPGDHVPTKWPRTMTFKAQWAKPEEVVHLRYHPNGGTPEAYHPSEEGFAYKKNATAAVWDNTDADGAAHFTRPGYKFIGWNTEPDGSGTAYPPDSSIVLTAPVTTLYAQWKRTSYNLSVNKVDSENDGFLAGAEFSLYREENGAYYPVGETMTTGNDGRIGFQNLETNTMYKLVEEKSPDGYAIITKEVFFSMVPNGNTVSLKFYDKNGTEISAPNGVSGQYVSDNGLLTLTVENLRGYELSVCKVDSEDKSALDGAVFSLYREGNGTYYLVGDTVTTDGEGRITFEKLDALTKYKLVEEKSPDGYAIITKEIFFGIMLNGDTLELKFYDSAGNVISAPMGVSGVYENESGEKLLTLTVENLRGYELPATGSTGIFFHILCGLILVLAPLVYGISLRRRYRKGARE